MSTIKSKEDPTYIVPSNALIPVINNAGTVAKSVSPQQMVDSTSIPAAIASNAAGIASNAGDIVALSQNLIADTLTRNFTSDADYTLSAPENLYGRVVLTDTSVFLTVARNVIVADTPRVIYVQNDTAQVLTFKTAAGTGITVPKNTSRQLMCDGVDVIDPSIDEFDITARGNASGLDTPVAGHNMTTLITTANQHHCDVTFDVAMDSTDYAVEVTQKSSPNGVHLYYGAKTLAGFWVRGTSVIGGAVSSYPIVACDITVTGGKNA